jgi:class 3 adenylate cyclase
MHRLFREQLGQAVGKSEFVIVQNLDIRGFSDWSLNVDSAQTALYIKKVYATLIDSYFKEASFIKPTGDGLLVITSFEEDELETEASRAIQRAIAIVESFGSLVEDDKMINFEVPQDVGFGIARGTASRLATEERTLDYSGRVLNLASRLMDLARPSGVVFDASYGVDLLPDEVAKDFREEAVYLKGIATSKPLTVYCWPPSVTISPIHRSPIDEERWEHQTLTTTPKELEEMAAKHYRWVLEPAPLPGATVECAVTHDAVTKGRRRSKKHEQSFGLEVSLRRAADRTVARIDQHQLATRLREKGVGPTWPVVVKISYRVG